MRICSIALRREFGEQIPQISKSNSLDRFVTFCTFHHNAGQASIAVQVDSGASK